MNTNTPLPRIAVTPGEPAGIGPDIVLLAAKHRFNAELVVVAEPDLLVKRADLLGLSIELIEFDPEKEPQLHKPGCLNILPVKHSIKGQPGKLDPADAAYIIKTLKTACQGCLDQKFSAMVTAPVHKANINQGGFTFSGHTEFLADVCKSGYPVMMLAGMYLRVVLVTTHLPLSQVSKVLTKDRLTNVIRIVSNDLCTRFGIKKPRLLVCGLNPHAGEDGLFGNEENQLIIPVLENLRQEGISIKGPVAADTAFTRDSLCDIDVVITMYHDQGLPVLKAQGFGEIVNITLGLPIIRTSVDHGTALTLAGTGQADCSSLISAIQCAIQLTNHNQTGLYSSLAKTSQSADAIL